MKRLFIFLTIPILANCLNVLFYVSVIAQSHIPFHNTAIKVLLDRGHTVDLVIAHLNEMVKIHFPAGIRQNYTFGYEDPNFWSKNAVHLFNIFEKKSVPFAEFLAFDDLTFQLCETVVKDPNLLEYIKKGKYDIGISSDYDPCANIIMHAGGVPVKASMIPTPMFQPQIYSAGLPSPASLYGTVLYPMHDESFFSRLFHLIRHTYNIYFVTPKLMARYDNLLLKTFGPTFPTAEEIERNVDIVLVNSNEIIEKPRPISHKIKYIGGMGKKKSKPLSEEFDQILDSADKGVVLFSFGTQVPTKKVPIEIRRNCVEAFKKFPEFLFLWKYDNLTEDAEMFDGVQNIHRVEWLPQTDLLGDIRVKAFISHMGLNSYIETATAGVPVLSIPLFIDQHHNAINAAAREIGVTVEKDQLTVENLVNALQKLLFDPKYSNNAKTISKMILEKPEQSEKLFVDWVEYAANNPGLHKARTPRIIINLPGAELTPFWYYSGDVIVASALFLMLSFYILWKIRDFFKRRVTIQFKWKSD
ncbi:CRE-UGT-54 protein [Caenorhabditis remanei]|uniref:glucuronosyltransferase n=1 Tax=Caenorhabditis remanei TaxID=31234 RepID=E3M580_CAERE|nr:CRE-UGT-54 protein [Caenorhabditis remanei]